MNIQCTSLGEFASSNAVQVALCSAVLREGSITSPRASSTRELLDVSFKITQPRRRLTTIPERNWNARLAFGELAWHLRGDTSVFPLAHYAKRWKEFASCDSEIRGSCYGAKIFRPDGRGTSQWARIRQLLRSDPSTRRAVLSFEDVHLDRESAPDVSCVSTIQFLVRNDKLHSFVTMRSNDVIWGVPYDVFLFSMFQELMALELTVDLGVYFHRAASMHIYSRHFALAERMALSQGAEDGTDHTPPIHLPSDLYDFALLEAQHRSSETTGPAAQSEFTRFCLGVLGPQAPKAA
jgi:thymidylate synthase